MSLQVVEQHTAYLLSETSPVTKSASPTLPPRPASPKLSSKFKPVHVTRGILSAAAVCILSTPLFDRAMSASRCSLCVM
jgi:hypothetical protein